MSDRLSRRHLLSLLAATAGLSACSRGSDNAPERWDVIVVGGGNAGLPAAIFAAQRGARVLIIDAAAALGGSLFLSSGQMSAAGTRLQADKGIEDSPQAHYDDVMRISKGTADPDILRLATDHAGETFDWLMANGFEVRANHPVTGTTHEPYSSARYAWGVEGGRSILKVLEQQLQPHIEAGLVDVRTSTEVTELIQDDAGAVQGVVARDADGISTQYLADNTLLTSGGYCSNPEMFERLEGVKDYSDVSYSYSQGIGITLGVAAGGYVRGGEHHLPLFGAILANDDYPSRMIGAVRPWPPRRPPWEIYVNAEGKRFLAEDTASHDAHEHALMAQTEERCWVIFDAAIFDQAPQLVQGTFSGPWTQDDVHTAFDSGMAMFYKADTVEELAQAAGISSAGLNETLADYNLGQANNEDAFGRKHLPLPIKQGPFYALQLQSWGLTGFAGIAVDDQLRVIREDRTAIANLYAAGELLGGGAFMGRSHCGGMFVTPALTFGRLLGQKLLPFA
ncbi:MAG: FAD-dependent oxidoreductase [Gammaproteobacteria bacterium]